jgi:DNA polymerase, archaea type
MEDLFVLLLEERRDAIQQLYDNCRASIASHTIGIGELMKTETLQDSPDVYKSKIGGKRRNVAAAYELALKASRPYQSGDRVSYYVAGNSKRVKVSAAAKLVTEYDPANPDENIDYYQAKLAELYEKFRPFCERPGLYVPSAAEAAPDSSAGQGDMFEPPGKA